MAANDSLDVFETERKTIAGQRALRAALRSKPPDRDITVWRQIAITLANEGPHRLSGLALSGGGIRSATFNLGVLQALNRFRVLGFDYLSTVSGGGYAGGWWSAWIARNVANPFPPEEGIETWRQYRKSREHLEGHAPNPDPINHLRLFSNYLTPRKGALSRDLWRAITVIGRNLLITWAALLPMLAVPVFLAQAFFLWAYELSPIDGPVPDEVFTRELPGAAQLWARGAAAAALPLAFAFFGVLTAFLWLMLQRGNVDRRERTLRNVQWTIVALAAIAAIGLLASVFPPGTPSPLAAFSIPVIAVAAWRVLRSRQADDDGDPARDDRLPNRLSRLQSVALVGAVASAVVLGMAAFGHELVKYVFFVEHRGLEALAVNVGKYLTLLTSIGSGIYAGWAGAPAGGSESGRSGRGNGFHVLIRIAPVLVLAVLLLATSWLGHSAAVALPFGTWSPLFRQITWIGVLAIVGVALFEPCERTRASRVAGALLLGAAALSLTADQGAGGPQLRVLAAVAAAVGTAGILAARARRARAGGEPCLAPGELLLLGAGTAAVVATGVAAGVGAGVMAPSEQAQLLLGVVGALATGVMLIGWTADPNALSLHMFYSSRLVRAYLGASNPNRKGHHTEDVTETKAKDDLPLTAISGDASPGPYHLINATLNLTAGRDLVIAQRPAAPFLFSRHYCGSSRTGFRPTDEYKGGSLTLGTAVAVSGAAASPIMGAQTPSTALSMLFAFLNVRLGYWTPTPGMPDWRSPQARLWPFFLLREFFAHTADTSRYCYVTDGGHFDNTGVHALVERGCSSIVLTDCGADPDCVFDDLASLVRRCRIDFAADIRFPDLTPFSKATMAASRKAFITGFIRYNRVHLLGLGWTAQQIAESLRRCPADQLQALGWDDIKTDGDGIGVLVVIKPTLRDRLETDVQRYSQQHADFPQQSTGDQWFDEAQFESYRRLGDASGQAAAAEIRKQFPEVVF